MTLDGMAVTLGIARRSIAEYGRISPFPGIWLWPFGSSNKKPRSKAFQKAAGASRKGNLHESVTAVKRLADPVVAMAQRLRMTDGAGRVIAFACLQDKPTNCRTPSHFWIDTRSHEFAFGIGCRSPYRKRMRILREVLFASQMRSPFPLRSASGGTSYDSSIQIGLQISPMRSSHPLSSSSTSKWQSSNGITTSLSA